MIIVDVDSSNAGQYVCVATNEGGVSESHMTLHVVKKDLPNVRIRRAIIPLLKFR